MNWGEILLLLSMPICYIAHNAAPATILMKDESSVAARLLRNRETRVSLP